MWIRAGQDHVAGNVALHVASLRTYAAATGYRDHQHHDDDDIVCKQNHVMHICKLHPCCELLPWNLLCMVLQLLS